LSPRDARFQDRVWDGDELVGDGDNDKLVRLAALRARIQNRVATGGGKCGLEQDMSKQAPPSRDCSPASHRSTVM
jgi:hypothetical protein